MIHLRIFDDPIILEIGPVPVTRTALTSLCVSAALISVAALMRAAVLRHPGNRLAIVAEETVQAVDRMVADIVSRPVPWLVSFSGSLFLLIAACNVASQLPGVTPPMSNPVATSALAVVVFLTVPAAGIISQGPWKYLRHYFRPNPLLFPLHLISEISRTFALSMRLFGNMMSGHLIVVLLVALAGLFVPTPLMALDLLIGLLQAYIFTLLSTVYIGSALRSADE